MLLSCLVVSLHQSIEQFCCRFLEEPCLFGAAMNKCILTFFKPFFFFFLFYAAFGDSANCFALQTPSTYKLQSITVVADDNYPPYIFRSADGKLQGILVDEWRLWEKKTGIPVQLFGMDWWKAKEFLADGKADVIDTIFFTEERATVLDFSKPYATLEVPIFFNKDISGISGPASLRGFTIGVKTGDTCVDVLKKSGVTTLLEYQNYEEIIQAAADGTIKVYCMDKPPALYYLYKKDLEARFRHTQPLFTGQFHRAVLKGRTDILDKVEQGFSLISDDERRMIERKWMGSALHSSSSLVRYGLYSALGVVLLMALLVLWNTMLRKRVSAQTSELRTALEKLGANEALLKAIIESLPYDFYAIDMEGRYFMQNNASVRRWGNVIGKRPDEVILHFPDQTQWLENNRRAFNGEMIKQETEYVIRGENHHFLEMVMPIWNADQQMLGILGVNFDLTDQRYIEDAFRESMRKYRALIETTHTGFVILDKDGQVFDANAEYVRLTGHSRLSEIVNRPVTDWTADSMKERNADAVHKCFARGGIRDYEVDYVDKHGRITSVEINAKVVDTKNGRQILTLCRDITERKKIDEQLRQSQKLEAIGKLAGGVAHDFNNILSAIIGYATLMQMQLADGDPNSRNIEQILHASERAATLIRRLLSFSRKQVIALNFCDLNDIVRRAENLLFRLIREDIELKTVCTDHALTVLADAAQLEQVLMNLITNARDAMPDGGAITIRTGTVFMDMDFVRSHGYGATGEYARIAVSDTGAGMDAATQARIFAPFFTTKEQGKGTGLGLSMVYGIVKQHNGYIDVRSEPGKGSTFSVYLPLSKEGVAEERWEVEPVQPQGGLETILVAEDDSTVRTLTATILRSHGYTVIEAGDGEDAVAQFVANRDLVQLLLLDGIMPRKNGKEAYLEIRKMNPDIKVIFISGYAENIINWEGMLEPGVSFLMKPLAPSVLLKKVRENLDVNWR